MSIDRFSKINFIKSTAYYVLFLIFLWICYLALISVSSAFHFMLDHRLSEIEEWLYVYSWELALIAKIFASFVGLKFVLVKTDNRHFRQEFKGLSFIQNQKFYFLVSLVFLFLSVVIMGNPRINGDYSFSIWHLILSYIGCVAFYGADFVFLYSLKLIFPNQSYFRLLRLVLFSVLFYVANKWIFVYSENIENVSVFIFYTILLYSEFERGYAFLPVFLLLWIVAPLATLFGVDPMFGASNSLFVMTNSFMSSSLFCIVVVLTSYLLIKKFTFKVILRYLKANFNLHFHKLVTRD